MKLKENSKLNKKLHQVPAYELSPTLQITDTWNIFSVRELKTIRRNIYDKHRQNCMAKSTEMGKHGLLLRNLFG